MVECEIQPHKSERVARGQFHRHPRRRASFVAAKEGTVIVQLNDNGELQTNMLRNSECYA
jgi:hypothetical protein